jgi:mannose-6-phosphate isomerase-like protein (cupin superfamily)
MVSAQAGSPPAFAGGCEVAFMDKISIGPKFALFAERWRPKVIAEANGHEVKLVKVQGTFPWHRHESADEMFLVWRGCFRVEFRDQVVELGPGELIVVPRGVEHRTAAAEEAEVIIFEPAETRNTGDVVSDEFTAPQGVRI